MTQSLQHRHAARAMYGLLAFEFLLQSAAFLWREPPCIARPILQQEESDNTQNDRGNTPENVNALPAFKAKQLRMMHDHVIHRFIGSNLEQRIRNLRADDLGDRRRYQKARQRSRPVPAGKPMRQIHNDSRKESGFREAKKETNNVELGW